MKHYVFGVGFVFFAIAALWPMYAHAQIRSYYILPYPLTGWGDTLLEVRWQEPEEPIVGCNNEKYIIDAYVRVACDKDSSGVFVPERVDSVWLEMLFVRVWNEHQRHMELYQQFNFVLGKRIAPKRGCMASMETLDQIARWYQAAIANIVLEPTSNWIENAKRVSSDFSSFRVVLSTTNMDYLRLSQ